MNISLVSFARGLPLTVLLLAAICISPAPAEAQCIMITQIVANAASGPPGTVVTVEGGGFGRCFDLVIDGVRRPVEPALGVVILFIQGDRTWRLATVDANSKSEISVKVTIPNDAAIGEASLAAEAFGRRGKLIPFRVVAQEAPR